MRVLYLLMVLGKAKQHRGRASRSSGAFLGRLRQAIALI